MPKGKCQMKSAKASRNMCVQAKEKFTARKQTNKELETFDEMDSLSFLKDTKERKKLDDIDGRIELLKSELKLLMDGKKLDETSDNDKNLCNLQKIGERANEAGCNIILEESRDHKKNSVKKLNEYTPSTSTPCKFTEEANCHYQNETIDLHDINNSTLEFQTQDSTCNRFTQNKVEELLYKTFKVQNGVVHLSNLDDTCPKSIISKRKTKDQESCSKSEKTFKKCNTEKPTQGNNKNLRASKRVRKKRIVSVHNSDSEVEVINLDSTAFDSEGYKTDQTCIDLDVNNYDWGEPFGLDDHSEPDFDVQIINEPQKENGEMNNKELKAHSLEHKEGDASVDSVKKGNKVWECPVCLDQSKGQEIVATQCGHIFCKTCLEAHTSKIKNNCPTCRADLRNKPFITLFNF